MKCLLKHTGLSNRFPSEKLESYQSPIVNTIWSRTWLDRAIYSIKFYLRYNGAIYGAR